MINNSFKDLKYIRPLQKKKCFLTIQHTILFHWQYKVIDMVDPFLPSFLDSFYTSLNLFSSWI